MAHATTERIGDTPRRVRTIRTIRTPRFSPRPLAPAMLGLVLASFGSPASADSEQRMGDVVVSERQERADGPVQGYRATRSSTLTRTDTALRDVPQSVQVVSEELIKDAGLRSIGQILRYVPGTAINPGEGGRDQPVLRGISTNADFFLDGVRDDALYFRDPYNAERVEILKGPSGMTFGRGGAGGVINRVSKRPLEDNMQRYEGSVGSNELKRATADLNQRFGNGVGLRVNAIVEDSGSFRDGVKLKRSGINPVLEFSPGRDTVLTLGLEHFDDRRTVDRGIPSLNGKPYDTARSTFFGNAAQSPGKATVDSFSARLEHAISPTTTLRNTFRATHYETFRQNVYASDAVGATTAGMVKIAAYSTENSRTNVFNQTELESRIQAGGFEHQILLGLELGRQASDNVRLTGYFGATDSTLVSATNPNANVTRWAAKASDTNNKVNADIAAVYVQDQIALTPHWKAVLGLRHDTFRVNVDDRTTTNADLRRTDNEFSPRAGLIYQPDSVSSYYASYSYTFIPSGETLSLATTNAELEPETATNWELGGKWELGRDLSVTGAVFRLDRDKVKTRDPADSTKLILGGLQRTEGFELGLQGKLTDRWQVYGGYANLDARVVKATGGSSTSAAVPAGRVVALMPKNMFSLWNRYDFDAKWSAALGLVAQSSIYASTSNAVTLAGYSRADGAIYYQIDRNLRLALNVENLFDRKYYASAGGDNNIIVGNPRSAQLSLSAKF